jgi:uncharacterized protein
MPVTDATIAKPWYRERWPWILMAGPAFVVCGGAYAMWLAKSTDDGLVADDYYKRGMAINRTLQRFERAAALKVGAIVEIAPDGGVRVTLSGIEDGVPPSLRLRLVHPTKAGLDESAEVVRSADGTYAGRIAPPPSVRWLVIVETDAWRLPAVETKNGLDHVRLGDARS